MVAYLHYFVVLEQIVVPLMDPGPSLVFVPLLVVEFDIMAPSWEAFFDVHAHFIYVFAWERLVVLDQT
jgi:hypothetical protein